MVAVTERQRVGASIDVGIDDWPIVDTDWQYEGWEAPCGPPNPKLSALMRRGARGHGQHVGQYFGPRESVCALGAVYAGITGIYRFVSNSERENGWEQIMRTIGVQDSPRVAVPNVVIERACKCQVCLGARRDNKAAIDELIVRLNDDVQMPIELIADWVESVGY